MKFRTPYNFDSDVSSSLTSFAFDPEDDRAQQSFKDECDINTLVKTFARTGIMPPPVGGYTFEVDEIIDYQTALNRLMEADRSFMNLPSAVRDRFQNDPAQLLDFVRKPDNRDEAIELGLIAKPAENPVLARLSEVVDAVKSQAAPISGS